MTKNNSYPAGLIRLLLIRAGIEQNPGPWYCPICNKATTPTSVECSKCHKWLHIKCSGFKTSKDRLKYKIWHGPCCNSSTNPPAASTPPPPPTPTTPPSPPPQQFQPPDEENSDNLRLLQYNINGIASKLDELLHYLDKNNIKVAVIQETKLTIKSSTLNTKNYTLVRKDRGKNKGGGLAFLVHESVTFYQETTPPTLSNDPHLESLTITIPGKDNKLQIRNIYIPPYSSCQPQYTPPLNNIFDELNDTSIVIGDFNAHNALWFSNGNQDARGRILADIITEKPFGVLNEDSATRIAGDTYSSPDISLVSNSLLSSSSWKTEISLNSDHLPIIIDIEANITKKKSQDRVYINFAKANWAKFTEKTELIFSDAYITDDVHKDERFFRNTIQDVAAEFIPAGRIMHTINEIPTEALHDIEERDRIRRNNPSDPRLILLNNNINNKIRKHKLGKWKDHLNDCKPNSKELWSTIKNIDSQPKQPENQGIKFNDKVQVNPKKLADKFNQQFTPPLDKKPIQHSRNILRNLKKKTSDPEVNITEKQVQEAIDKSKNSKALGPDDISPIMLKHLGPKGIHFLTEIYNNCVNTSTIPSLWKTGRIIPLLKPGKPADEGTSFRPISLLSPPAKILEKVLLPEINKAVNLARHQHGFRKGHSTNTALHTINNHITKGLNKNKPVDRTVTVAIDLSRAFDTVDHDILHEDILGLHLNGHIKRFLCAYIR